MKTKYIYHIILVFIPLLVADHIVAQGRNIILSIKKEVDRNLDELRIENLQSPFFISYTIANIEELKISAVGGSLQFSRQSKKSRGYPFLLVGDYHRNNQTFVNSPFPAEGLALDNDPKGIATVIWRDLDSGYKNVAERFERNSSILRQQRQYDEDMNVADFQKAEPVKLYMESVSIKMDKNYWEDYALQASETFNNYPEIIHAKVNINIGNITTYYYNTEGSEVIIPYPYYEVHVNLFTLTDDGQELSDDFFYQQSDIKDMPSLKSFKEECIALAEYFLQLKNAPLIDEVYSGPVLFERMACARIVSHLFFTNGNNNSLITTRKPIIDARSYASLAQGNNLEMMINKKIISRSLSLTSLSGTPNYKGTKLNGYYPVDNQGIAPAKEMVLIDNGVLKNMLNGRVPTKNYPESNGHARWNIVASAPLVSPGNVRLSSTDAYSPSDLKKKLIEAVKEEDLDYGYIVKRMRGNNVVAYKVYVTDGREELVRGASLPDLNMKSFKRVLGATNTEFIYNTMWFGNFTTYIVPEGLLFEELEVTRNNGLNLRSPYLVPKP